MYTIWAVTSLLIAVCQAAARPGDTFPLYVRPADGQALPIELPNTATVGVLRAVVRGIMATGAAAQMSVGGTVLSDDDATLADLGICAETVVDLVKPTVLVQVRHSTDVPFTNVEVEAWTFQELFDGFTQKITDITDNAEKVNWVYDFCSEGHVVDLRDDQASILKSVSRIMEGLEPYGIVVTKEELMSHWHDDGKRVYWRFQGPMMYEWPQYGSAPSHDESQDGRVPQHYCSEVDEVQIVKFMIGILSLSFLGILIVMVALMLV